MKGRNSPLIVLLHHFSSYCYLLMIFFLSLSQCVCADCSRRAHKKNSYLTAELGQIFHNRLDEAFPTTTIGGRGALFAQWKNADLRVNLFLSSFSSLSVLCTYQKGFFVRFRVRKFKSALLKAMFTQFTQLKKKIKHEINRTYVVQRDFCFSSRFYFHISNGSLSISVCYYRTELENKCIWLQGATRGAWVQSRTVS